MHVSVLFHFCQVRDVLEMKFYIFDVLLICVTKICGGTHRNP